MLKSVEDGRRDDGVDGNKRSAGSTALSSRVESSRLVPTLTVLNRPVK